ncbi:hypothetical protein ACFSQD_14335 [Flavihumibacter stibioxidans]|uniref:PAP2 superfamily protein n=1 Tax=Flavihumibacter stibioxidans TaxID=1834163 RepID=A0ABR7M8Q5_9BACT|nr:hypothetical protein [Flavihumibacter stibioxidans]MBC6491219.1 hypothetical protein [Flavihumibacter stibioxidans]
MMVSTEQPNTSAVADPSGVHPSGGTRRVNAGWVIGQLISFVFHPLFIPGYITAFLLFVHPFAFAGENEWYKKIKLISVLVSTAFFPAFTVFLLKQLGFASSFQLKTQKERIIPIVASMVFYFWIFYVSKNRPDNPPELVKMLCAVFITSIIALTANNFIKISLHAIAMGVLVSFFVYMAWTSLIPMIVPLAVSILIAGLVGTARLMTGAHSNSELVWGFATGVVSMFIAVWVV